MHIQFVYGLGLIGLFALEASLPAGTRQALSAESGTRLRAALWILLAAACLATLVNPYGWNLYRVVWQYAAQSAPLLLVQEMQSMPFRTPSNWIALLLIGAAIFAMGRARSKNLLLLSLLVFSSYFGFRSQRDIWFPVTAAVLALAWEIRNPAGLVRSRWTWWIAIPLSFLITAFFLTHDNRFSDGAMQEAIDRHFPVQASAYVQSHGMQGPVYNSYNWGGYLIWRLPEMPVAIDGRANLYETYLTDSAKTIAGQKKLVPGFRSQKSAHDHSGTRRRPGVHPARGPTISPRL